ncbi:MAG: NAD-dependent succinate-semialdehyde dehydrogenase [Planctomycetaceae bacterium]|nr:NAD-dependent succinate-semialdehyde dehydrogenase [Planctomycetaceae bacterium]
MSILSVNPTTGETLKSYTALTKAQIDSAIETAHDAYIQWKETTFEARQQILLKFARALRSRTDEFAKLITLEMGKRISESRREVIYCAEITEFYANGAAGFLADQPMNVPGIDAWIQHTPIGVLLGVMPWNFPFYQVVRFATPNIMAGNTVLLKHAGNVPQCAEKIQTLFDECDLPAGVYTNLFISTDMVETILADKRVQGVSLTGSERAGSAVAALAGKFLKRSVLELGGNDAFVVLEDADLSAVVEMAVKGRMVNAGQSCVASKRFIVVESLAKPFMDEFKQRIDAMKMGDPMDESTDIGPLSTEAAAENLLKQVESAVNAGASLIIGGDRPQRPGAFFNPTILTDITPEMPTYDQELFGPVASVYVVKDEAAAIKLANDSSYGLGGSVYTSDIARGRRAAEQIESGMVFINQPTRSQAELPFGGIKNSGYGRELSALGIMEFINKKLIHAGR